MGVDVDGFDPFDGMAEELEAEIREELHRSAEDMASIARATAPRDTGALADSITVQRVDDALAVEVRAAEDDAYHGIFQEYGTAKMDAHPFFFAAYDAVADAFEERMAELLGSAE